MALALSFLGLMAFGFTRSPADLPSALLDLPAPEFDLEVMSEQEPTAGGPAELGERIRLSELRGAPFVLNYWASWCLACREEHQALSEAAIRYREAGVRFFGVLYQDTPANARRWIKAMGGQSYRTLLDPRMHTAIEYGVYGVPETYFIDAKGIIVHKHLGPVTSTVLDEQIEALLARRGGASDS
jgi:cytochrome c biogenesis protein CcmG/thiol:disulfide interchange protein DsbE